MEDKALTTALQSSQDLLRSCELQGLELREGGREEGGREGEGGRERVGEGGLEEREKVLRRSSELAQLQIRMTEVRDGVATWSVLDCYCGGGLLSIFNNHHFVFVHCNFVCYNS